MCEITVFKWGYVFLAEEYLTMLEKRGKTKEEIINDLTDHVGISAIYDEDGCVKLEGSWPLLVKAQSTLQHYVSNNNQLNCKKNVECSLNSCEIETNDSFKNFSSADIDSEKHELNYNSSLCIKDNLPVGNEVYVNITLSNASASALSLDEKRKYDIHSQNEKECNLLNTPTSKELCNVSQWPVTKGIESTRKEEEKYKHTTENRNIMNVLKLSHGSLLHQENSCDYFNKNEQNCAKTVTAISNKMCNIENSVHTAKELDLLENNASGLTLEKENGNSEISVRKDRCAKEVLSGPSTSPIFQSDNNCTSKVKQKYIKKIDYEELAPFKFFCSFCSFKSKRNSHYQRHIKLHNEVSDLFKCSKCNFTSIRLSHLRRHELTHSTSKLACNSCNYTTNNQKLLTRHERIKHSSTQSTESEEILKCVHCEYETTRNSFLQRHLKVHLRESSEIHIYGCEECPYKTNLKEHLIRHVNNIHKGQRPFLCDHCGKAFKRQDALKQHVTTHITEASVMCPACGKGCRSQAHLTQHMSVHSNERSFLCELCGASFKTRAVQRKHLHTIHQYPKAFFCNHCSRKFSTKFALRRHIKQHSSEKKSKTDEQEKKGNPHLPVVVPENCGSVRILSTETVLLHDPTRASCVEQVQETHFTRDGEKITVRLVEASDPDTYHIIPSQSLVPQGSETTALYYLTGTFAPY